MDTANWSGYEFVVCNQEGPWADLGGVYIFCGVSSDSHWVPIYVGETGNFRTRIPSHERWNQAKQLGATHVHAKTVVREAERKALEEFLILAFQPPLNVQLKQTYSTRP